MVVGLTDALPEVNLLAPNLEGLPGVVLVSSPGLAESLALVAAPAPPVDSLEVVASVFPPAPNLLPVFLEEAAPVPFSASLAFSSSFAFIVFYFSRSLAFLASVAFVDPGLTNLDGALSPPAPPSEVPSLLVDSSLPAEAFASSAAFLSASLRAYLSKRVNLGLVGEATLASLEVSAEDVEDFVEDTTLDLLVLSSSVTLAVLGLSSSLISFFSSTFSLSI